MREEFGNVIGEEPAAIAAEPSQGSEDGIVKAGSGCDLSAPAVAATVVTVALPLLKVQNARAEDGVSHCSSDGNQGAEVGDPGDCADCSAVMSPQDCSTDTADFDPNMDINSDDAGDGGGGGGGDYGS
jgi:hypothetical protein